MGLEILTEAKPCVGSGMCCKQAPCPYGEWDKKKSSCKHLVEITTDNEQHSRYGCGIYHDIIKHPDAYFYPAFGTGCCSSLCNSDRQSILRENEGQSGDPYIAPQQFN